MVVEQTVAGTDAFKPGVWIFLVLKRIWLVRYCTVPVSNIGLFRGSCF